MKHDSHCHKIKELSPTRRVRHLEALAPGWNEIEAPTDLDRWAHAAIALGTHGISPVSLALA